MADNQRSNFKNPAQIRKNGKKKGQILSGPRIILIGASMN
jgi:hypothetical protein